jgi:GT2 family glycosyltransferase
MISAVVPTYGGAGRLARNLPSVVASLAASGADWEIVVVDDGGGGVEAAWAGARVVRLAKNRGYGPAVNAGADAAAGEFLLVLNDDVRLEQGTVAALRALFPDPALFAAVPSIRSPLARSGDEAGKAGEWRGGLVEILERPAGIAPRPTLYPVGCCYLCPRALFLDLGGYDDVYAPFLWEDVDLGYRAWRRGLRVVHQPGAACDHEGSATLAERHTLEERERIGFRNRVLFHLRNVQDPALRAENLGALVAFALFEPRRERLEGLKDALAVYSGPDTRTLVGLPDRELLERSSGSR